MPAKSKAQQRFFGMVRAAQKGETPASEEVAQAAQEMQEGDVKAFASTKQSNLPERVAKRPMGKKKQQRKPPGVRITG